MARDNNTGKTKGFYESAAKRVQEHTDNGAYEQREEMYKAIRKVCSLLGMSMAENAALRRGEFICQRCSLRKDSEHDTKHEF